MSQMISAASLVRRRRRSPRGDGVHLARQQVDVVLILLNHVEPGLRRRQPGDPVHPNHPAAPRGERQGIEEATRFAVLRLGPLARLARAYVLRHVDVLPHPEGQASNQRSRLGPAEVPAEWAVVALAENLRPQVATRRDAQPVCRALAAAVQ